VYRGRIFANSVNWSAWTPTDLTPEQLKQVLAKLAPVTHYLARLKARMVEQDFPPDDEL